MGNNNKIQQEEQMVKGKINRSIRVLKYVIYKETLFNSREMFWSFVGSFIAIGTIAVIQTTMLPHFENVFLIGSFGASCLLVFGAIQSPLAQPRNFILGNFISALIGVTIGKLFPETLWLSAPFAVSFSIVAMQYTKSLHPPAGATALIAVISGEQIKSLGYLYAFTPILAGTMIIFVIALLFNNITENRRYPAKGRLADFIKVRIWRLKKQ